MFQDEIFRDDFFALDQKTELAEWFYSHYKEYSAEDIYAWLWAGEFGYRPDGYPDADLHQLLSDIRMARQKPGLINAVWEPLGLENSLVKVNIAHYADAGCPLPRLIQLSERIREEIDPNALRFKSNWNLMKAQIYEGSALRLSQVHQFEDSIPFNMTPYIPFSNAFAEQFGSYYRIVPAALFFEYFPEFEVYYYRHEREERRSRSLGESSEE